MIWFGLVLWHINHFRLFNAKSSLYTYISNVYDLVGLGFMANAVQCHIQNTRSRVATPL